MLGTWTLWVNVSEPGLKLLLYSGVECTCRCCGHTGNMSEADLRHAQGCPMQTRGLASSARAYSAQSNYHL